MSKVRTFLNKIKTPSILAGLCFTLLLLFFWHTIVITVLPGHLGVFYSRLFGGTDLEKVYGEGIHVKWPWDKMYIYDTRIQENKLDLNLLTQDGVLITVIVSTRYQVMKELLPQLHVLVGPQYLEKIIIPSITSAVRQTLGKHRPSDLYSTARQELQDQILVEAIVEIARIPIILHNIIVKRLELPETVNQAINKKLVAEQEYLRYQYVLKSSVQEAKRKTIEGFGIRKYQELVNERMTNDFLRFEGIKATRKLAASNNAKLVLVGGGKDGLPIILNSADAVQLDGKTIAPQEPRPAEITASGNAADKAAEDQQEEPLPKPEPFDEGDLMEKLKYFDQLLLNPMQREKK